MLASIPVNLAYTPNNFLHKKMFCEEGLDRTKEVKVEEETRALKKKKRKEK